jgi:hypothetical protein
MNVWKMSTIVLATALAVLVGRDAFDKADAAENGTGRPATVGYDWAQEQPHMDQALKDLRGARRSLELASEHKGGWRVLALKHTDEAITETIRGMEYAKNHPKE